MLTWFDRAIDRYNHRHALRVGESALARDPAFALFQYCNDIPWDENIRPALVQESSPVVHRDPGWRGVFGRPAAPLSTTWPIGDARSVDIRMTTNDRLVVFELWDVHGVGFARHFPPCSTPEMAVFDAQATWDAMHKAGWTFPATDFRFDLEGLKRALLERHASRLVPLVMDVRNGVLTYGEACTRLAHPEQIEAFNVLIPRAGESSDLRLQRIARYPIAAATERQVLRHIVAFPGGIRGSSERVASEAFRAIHRLDRLSKQAGFGLEEG